MPVTILKVEEDSEQCRTLSLSGAGVIEGNKFSVPSGNSLKVQFVGKGSQKLDFQMTLDGFVLPLEAVSTGHPGVTLFENTDTSVAITVKLSPSQNNRPVINDGDVNPSEKLGELELTPTGGVGDPWGGNQRP